MVGLDLWRGRLGPRSLLGTWDSFSHEIDWMLRDMDRFFEPVRPSLGAAFPAVGAFTPTCDLEESEDEYRLSFDVPGVRKEDVNISLEGNRLTVTGERKLEQEKETAKGVRRYMERPYGRFARTIMLPKDVDTEHVEASYQNGVLEIHLKKSERRRSKKIEIKGETESKTIEASAPASNDQDVG